MRLFDRLVDHVADRVLDRIDERKPKAKVGPSFNINVGPGVEHFSQRLAEAGKAGGKALAGAVAAEERLAKARRDQRKCQETAGGTPVGKVYHPEPLG